MLRLLARVFIVFISSYGLAANATLITSASDIGGTPTVIDFSDHPAQEITLGPTQLGNLVGQNVIFTATNSFDVAGFSAALYGLGANGTWDSNTRSFAWVNPGAVATMRFSFLDAPVSSVGAFMNYCTNLPFSGPGCGTDGVLLSALDSSLAPLESYRLDTSAPINTPDERDAGAFRGISRSTADIFAFELSGAGVLDDLTFFRAATQGQVPEPSSLALLALSLGLLTLVCRSRVSRP